MWLTITVCGLLHPFQKILNFEFECKHGLYRNFYPKKFLIRWKDRVRYAKACFFFSKISLFGLLRVAAACLSGGCWQFERRKSCGRGRTCAYVRAYSNGNDGNIGSWTTSFGVLQMSHCHNYIKHFYKRLKVFLHPAAQTAFLIIYIKINIFSHGQHNRMKKVIFARNRPRPCRTWYRQWRTRPFRGRRC